MTKPNKPRSTALLTATILTTALLGGILCSLAASGDTITLPSVSFSH